MCRFNYKSAYIYTIHRKSTNDTYEKEYLRVIENYIGYYYKYAERYKWLYLILSSFKVVILAAIPVTQTITQLKGYPWIVSGASAACILLESALELFQVKDKWILYRRTGNELMREEREYITKSGKYAIEDENKLTCRFVENAEHIISSEASKWNQILLAKKTEGESQSGMKNQ